MRVILGSTHCEGIQMNRIFQNAAAAVTTLVLFTAPASAQSYSWWRSWWGGWSGTDGGHTRSSVPEIDASTGMLAMAAVGAALLLAWEINRRRKKS